ncbi:MAG TPA: ADOP family duplicated permease, partial [Vicinamibacterales bacterium]
SDRTERLRGAFATPNLFTVLGVHAAHGRVFSADDGDAALLQEAVISDRLWRRSFAGDPAIVGRTIHVLGGRPRGPLDLTIVGVLPSDFRYSYPDDTEIWAPLVAPRTRIIRGSMFGQVVARLVPGVTITQASSELTALEGRMAAEHPTEGFHGHLVVATPFRQQLTRTARPLMVTLGVVAVFVLLIACVNVANLLLARSVARGRELAVRTALGASRRRLLWQITIESALLGGLGGTVGLGVLLAALPVWQAVVPTSLPRGDEMRIDASVLAVCAGAAVAAILIGALAAFVFGASRSPLARLKEGGSGQPGDARAATWRRAVVTVQVAVVFTLLVGAGLLLESFWRLSHVDLGYDGRQVLTMDMRVLGSQTGSDDRIMRIQSDILDAVRALPGVTEAAMTSAVPLRGTDWVIGLNVALPGQPAKAASANLREVSPEYFEVMRIPRVSGRLLDAHDAARSAKVAVVSQSFARILAGDGPVIGRRLHGDRSGDEVAEIVGVVGDVRTQTIAKEAMPAIYVPRAQDPSELICLVIRTAPGQLQSVTAATRAAIHRVAPMLPAEHVTTLDAIVSQSIADRRFDTAATTAFAGVGLLLAIVGLAGVVSRSIVERVREIAVRAALGADGARLRRMIVGEALRPVMVGLMGGLLTASWLTTWLQTQLYQVHPRDPLTFGGAMVFLALVATIAAYVPARSATTIDPMEALRAE